ncbi:hypothetical protein F2Q69_00011425 [Brassica cretica]|uniref:Uncharacterized protein n=1 Tax=Brassica cretica TaxID=69181 RepID=A0A8S9QPD7_BRACR|nr:hypothetical protein F2Q69_00011425 [Brassica cretica]
MVWGLSTSVRWSSFSQTGAGADGFFPFVTFMKLGQVRGLFELYCSFEKIRREIEVYRSDCSFVGRLPPRFVRDCSGFGVVFIQLPAV